MTVDVYDAMQYPGSDGGPLRTGPPQAPTFEYVGDPNSTAVTNKTETATATATLTATETATATRSGSWLNETEYAPARRGRETVVIGGIVFEFMDEWWKGSLYDTYHKDCELDYEFTQSSCGARA